MDNIEEQYDKIYRYCYYKVKNRDLYRIAHNLCIDEFRRVKPDPIDDVDVSDGTNLSESVVDSIVLNEALSGLSEEEREVLLLLLSSRLL